MSLEIGITPWRVDPSAPASVLTEQAARAESLGFHSFWLWESHFTGPQSNPMPLLQLAAVAACTRTLKVATVSYLLPLRNPVQMAEEVAVLDCLSGGRLILGVGRGFGQALFAAYDLDEGEKRDRFEHALGVMRDAWDGKPVASLPDDGGVILSPLPVQQPHPPIWAAALGPKALALSGRLGLPYLCSPFEPLGRLTEKYAAHRAAVVESHGEIDLEVPVMRTIFAHADASVRERVRVGLDREAQRMARTAAGPVRRMASADLDEWALVGELADVQDRLARYREELGITHVVAHTRMPGADESEVHAGLEGLAALAEAS